MKKTFNVLIIAGVWASIVVLVYLVWDSALIAKPKLFYPALIGLIVFSAAFSSAETAFTILQEDWQAVAEHRRRSGATHDTKLQTWLDYYAAPAWVVRARHRLSSTNITG